MHRATETPYANATENVTCRANRYDGERELIRVETCELSIALVLPPQDLHALWVTLGQSLKEYGF